MCRTNGPRCSDYAVKTLDITRRRLDKAKAELAEYEAKYEESLTKTEDVSKRDEIRKQKQARLQQEVEAQEAAFAEAEFEYHSCPVGQKELQEDLAKAELENNEALKEELQARITAGQEYRKNLRENIKKVEAVEAEQGPEAAETAAMDLYEEAVEEEAQATIGLQETALELEAARAEQEEYERAMEEYRKSNRIDTPEEDAAKAKKRKLILTAVVMLAIGVVIYGLMRQSATGKQSSMLQMGRSMAMRQGMMGGRRFIGNVIQGDRKQLDARERRGEQDAEQRAGKARERVYQQAEQQKIVANRTAAKESERQGEILHRRMLQEETREADRARREEEYAHYEKLSNIELPPEVMAELKKKVRKPQKAKVEAEPVLA